MYFFKLILQPNFHFLYIVSSFLNLNPTSVKSILKFTPSDFGICNVFIEINPYFSRKTTGIRTPWACHPAQVVQKRENRCQPSFYIPLQHHCIFQCVIMPGDEIIQIPIDDSPCHFRTPRRFGTVKNVFHDCTRIYLYQTC
jgi:hypothetical protein